MDEQVKPRPPSSIEQRPRPGATRCPFCHEDCEADGDVCACAGCLSRHHRACWSEGAACASCGGRERLEPARTASAVAPVDAQGYGATLDAWLRLGLVYDLVLALISIVGLGPLLLRYGGDVLVGAIVANVCFLLGPAIELSARRMGFRGDWLRWCLFVPGLGLAALLAVLSVLSVLLAQP